MNNNNESSSNTITPGMTATISITVTESLTARAVGSGSEPVFATPMMIALMEQAACKAIEPGLGLGQTSVGTHIEASHLAPSPIGSEVSATATVTNISGKKVEFSVCAKDQSGEIGHGSHSRGIVDVEKFNKKALERQKQV